MKSNILTESKWGISTNTELGKEDEASELSVSLRILMRQAKKLEQENLLEWTFFGNIIHRCLEYLERGEINRLQKKLSDIAKILMERSIISSLLGLPDKNTFETYAHTFEKYSKLMARFKRFHKDSQDQIVNDLKRDLSALKMYVDQTVPRSRRVHPNDTGNIRATTFSIVGFRMKHGRRQAQYSNIGNYVPQEYVYPKN